MMADAMLTTIDNPYDPFTEFDEWYQYDSSHGYYSCSFLARVSLTSDSLSDNDNEKEIERAIDEIVSNNVLGIYKKVIKNN